MSDSTPTQAITDATIRPGYAKEAYITLGEAADMAGVKLCTLQRWPAEAVRTGYKRGPFKVCRVFFDDWLLTGRRKK